LDTPVPSAGATPVKRQQQRFHRAGGAGRFTQMNADCRHPLDTEYYMFLLKIVAPVKFAALVPIGNLTG
jgi:hypothetical protein